MKSDFRVLFSEASEQGRELLRGLGRELTESTAAVAGADVVILTVPDVVLGAVSAELVPLTNGRPSG